MVFFNSPTHADVIYGWFLVVPRGRRGPVVAHGGGGVVGGVGGVGPLVGAGRVALVGPVIL